MNFVGTIANDRSGIKEQAAVVAYSVIPELLRKPPNHQLK
jgi:hypothetical protein